MFRRTSHCVCQPNSSFKATHLKSPKDFQLNDEFIMHSPPLPPRTIKNNFSSSTKKYPFSKNTFSDWADKANCYDKNVQCNCSRPHSCPAEGSSLILTPPVPPKTCTAPNSQVKSKNLKSIDEQVKKIEKLHIESRKSSRHRGSEKSSGRKKSRSNSRSVARDDKSQLGNIDKMTFMSGNVDIRVNKFFTKTTTDNLTEKNCQKHYNKSNELCKVCDNDNDLKLQMRSFQEPSKCDMSASHQPDLIADRTNATGLVISGQIQSSTNNKPYPNKFRNKWKAKISQFLSKSKKSTDNPLPNNMRDNAVTPDNPHAIKYSDETPRPRRSKSLHMIPDSSLSPKTSMQMKPPVQTSTDAAITKNPSILAVISPSTARWKRNFFCISPKTGSSSSKKSEYNMSVVGASNNCQQRNPSSSISAAAGGRISPVHLIAKSSNNNTIVNNTIPISDSSSRRDKDPLTTSTNSHNSAKAQKISQNRQEKPEVLNSKVLPCAPKSRLRMHQDIAPSSKPSQSSSLTQSFTLNNSPNQIVCPCYHFNENLYNNPCNNNGAAYSSRLCTQFACIHNSNQSCTVYNIDSNNTADMGSACSQLCPCMRNVVHWSPNHFHCCHPTQNSNTAVLCSSCRIPIFCTTCSYNYYSNSNSKPAFPNKQPICHHSTSPPSCLARQLPPPPPPPPAAAAVSSFSNSHHYPRKNRQSYSKTPPPSFHTRQHSSICHDDHCYQEYNLNYSNHDNCQQKLLPNKSSSHQCNFFAASNAKSTSCCCSKALTNHCYMAAPHSKCTHCGSLIYDELSTISTHYNMNACHKGQFSNTPTGDSLLEIKWRSPTEQSMFNQCRLFTSSANNDESTNRLCHHNHCSNRHSGSCGHYSNEIKTPCCRNREKHLKRRKSSSHSCHGSNIDQDTEDKFTQHELSRSHYNSPSNNLLSSNSAHISPDLNPSIPNVDLSNSNINNLNINSNINMTSSTISANQITSLADSNDKFEPWRKTFKENMLALRNLGWYWGPLNHLEAENLVENRPDGTFLVRDSAHDTYFLSLTFRVLGTTYHTRIEYSQGKFSFWSQPESHSATTIVEFINKAVAHSASGKFHYFLQTSTPGQPPMEVSLLYPLSRYQIVQSLQHLARFVILSNIRKDHVSQLQLPSSLKGYLLEKQYYIDNIESFVKLTKDAVPLVYEPSRNLISNIQYNNL